MSDFVPKTVILDYETAYTDGTPALDYFRDDFRAVSAAVAWRGSDGTVKTRYLKGENKIRAFWVKLKAANVQVVVHNYQFEYGVTLHRFPGFEDLITYDTMRLAQNADNGGKLAHSSVKLTTYDDLLDAVESDSDPAQYLTGLSLVAACSRWLPPEWQDHKGPYHKYLRDEKGVKKGQEGRNLHLLPEDMFEKYNVADAIVTLLLYETLTQYALEQGYSCEQDHQLYKSTAQFVVTAKATGIKVNREPLKEYEGKLQAEVERIEQEFRKKFYFPIAELENEAIEHIVSALKTEKGRTRRRATLEADPSDVKFNVGSTKQLTALFVGKLGMKPKFMTKEPKKKPGKERKKPFVPQPSFKSAHLDTYGEGGTILKSRRKRMLVLQQTRALLSLSHRDGYWHLDIKVAGAATGRMAGGAVA